MRPTRYDLHRSLSAILRASHPDVAEAIDWLEATSAELDLDDHLLAVSNAETVLRKVGGQ